MLRLTSLTVEDTKITNLEGLQFATNLTQLRVHVGFSDATPISTLTKLKELHLFGATAPIAKLSQLTQLSLLEYSTAGTNDYSFLSGLTNLQSLSLTYNKMTQLPALTHQKKLTSLDISNNNIADLNALAILTSLEKLTAMSNRITDVEGLSGLPIKQLSLYANPLADITVLSSLPNLADVDLSYSLIKNVSPLLSNTSLQKANFSITCMPGANTDEQLQTLRNRGVSVVYVPTDASKLQTTLGETCSAASDTALNLVANYDANGNLDVSWQANNLSANTTGTCEFYFNIDKQQTRVAQRIENACRASASYSFNQLAYKPYNLLLRFRANTGSVVETQVLIGNTQLLGQDWVVRGVEWGQSVLTSNPQLVQNREALLRVHAAAQTVSTAPQLTVKLILNNQTLPITLTNPSATTFNGESDYVYSTIIPANWMKTGLKLSMALGNTAATELTPTFAKQVPVYITLVPMSISGTASNAPSNTEVETAIKQFWPISDVHVRTHSAYAASVGAGVEDVTEDLLPELENLRNIEGQQHIYYGFFNAALANNYAGRAYLPGLSGVSSDDARYERSGYLQLWASYMLHELGHSFGRPHINCGGPLGPDSEYPYNNNTTGSISLSPDLKTLYQPYAYNSGGFADIMSYCWPKSISDYSFNKVQDFLNSAYYAPFANGSNSAASLTMQKSATDNRSLYLSGSIYQTVPNAYIKITHLLPVDKTVYTQGNSEFLVDARYTDGTSIQRYAFIPQVDHDTTSKAEHFYVNLPMGELSELRISKAGITYFYQSTATNQISSAAILQKSSTDEISIREKASEVCLDWISKADLRVSLLWVDDGVTQALLLNKTDGRNCAGTQDVPTGGQWKLVTQKGLRISEKFVTR